MHHHSARGQEFPADSDTPVIMQVRAPDRGARKAKAYLYRRSLMDRDPDEIDYPSEKQCRRCKTQKHVGDFNIDLSVKDGLRQWCKACYKEYAQARRAAAKAAASPVATS